MSTSRLPNKNKYSKVNHNFNESRGVSPCHKDTRWDRIRKKYSTNTSTALKSSIAKKILETDFIGKHKEKLLSGDFDGRKRFYDPNLIMDLRHHAFQRIPKKLPIATVAREQRQQTNSCIVHNMAVEEHYIEHELKKFRSQLERNFKHNLLTERPKKDKSNNKMDNKPLLQSLKKTSQLFEDFYAAPVEALMESCDNIVAHAGLIFQAASASKENEPDNEKDLLFDSFHSEHPINGESHNIGTNICEEVSLKMNVASDNIVLKSSTKARAYSSDETAEANSINGRTVRFENSVEVRNYERENSLCSNTSDGIDSVISDIAEEVLNELELEENKDANPANEEEVKGKYENVQTAEKAGNEVSILVVKRCQLGPNPKQTQTTIEEKSSLSIDSHEDDNSSLHNEQNYFIKKLFQPNPNSSRIMKDYFLKWVHYTTMEKIERENFKSREDRVACINAFLDKVRREKRKQIRPKANETYETAHDKEAENSIGPNKIQAVAMAKKYKNKIKVQQDIIDMQRLKLERQERLIMELKLHKLSEEAKETRQDIKNELKAIINHGEPKAKAKAKCLQIIGNLKEKNEDEFDRLRGKAFAIPKFLQKMHDRALERSIKHEQARQRRLQQEAEKEAQKMAAEEAKRLEDEEAKRLRIEILKEKRRQEKIAKIMTERERQRAIENNKKAQEFYRKFLLKRVGMEAFKMLLKYKHENIRKSESFRRQLYKRTCFVAWRSFVVIQIEKKTSRAQTLYETILKRNTLTAWTEHINEAHCKHNVASDWWDLKLTERIFSSWWTFTKSMSLIEDTKMQQAIAHHEWHLKWKVLTCWQRLPQILKIEKETEERRQRWRLKIWELLPDYSPNRDDLT